MQYSSDLVHWTNAVPPLRGTGATVNWQDYGPPATTSPPGTQVQRFYRVLVSPSEQDDLLTRYDYLII